MSKTQKRVPDNSLLSTQHNKVGIKGKMELSRERSMLHPPLHCSVVATEKKPLTTVTNFTFISNLFIHLIQVTEHLQSQKFNNTRCIR